MTHSRFSTVILLHDNGDTPDGDVEKLAKILAESHPGVRFMRPFIPAMADAKAQFYVMTAWLLSQIYPNSLVVGLGLSGLFALVMQERFPALNLSVLAINPPPDKDGLEAELDAKATLSERVVLYSSEYEPLRGQYTAVWSDYADHALDVPCLSGGVQKALYATSYLISAFMRGLDLPKEVASLPPAQTSQTSI